MRGGHRPGVVALIRSTGVDAASVMAFIAGSAHIIAEVPQVSGRAEPFGAYLSLEHSGRFDAIPGLKRVVARLGSQSREFVVKLFAAFQVCIAFTLIAINGHNCNNKLQ